MLKEAENPPITFPEFQTVSDYPGEWWVAHTKARAEKAFAWDLLRQDVPYFLPMVRQTRMSGGRKRHVLAPLFPSYVFFCGDAESRYQALATDYLCQVIPVRDQARLVEELTSLERAVSGGAPLNPYPFAAVGKRCRVVAGPFEGVEGIVVRVDGRARIVLQVSMLGQGASLEIEPSLLEAID